MTVKRGQRSIGQALPLGLFFLLASAAVMYFMFNTGRSIDEKMRLTDAADAAAYSAATLEARALNYDAYVNRAMVANEVAIAQAVSLDSWIHYFENGVDNAGALGDLWGQWVFNPSEYQRFAMVTGAFGGTAYLNLWTGGTGLSKMVNYFDYVLAGVVTAHDTVVKLLSASQTALHASLLLGLQQKSLADFVVKKMDPAMSAEVVLTSYDFDGFTKSYSGNARQRLADVTMNSRDQFTKARNWTISGPNIPFVQNNVALKKRGGTDLIGLDEWRAMDTLEMHGQRFGCGKSHLSWCDDVQQSIAWGAAQVNALGGDQGKGNHGGSYQDNQRTSTKRADSAMVDMSSHYAVFSGIPNSIDLADLNAKSPTTGITVRVTKPRGATRTSGGTSIIQPTGSLAQFNASAPKSEIAALSRAEVFFARPLTRGEGAVEIGSLYDPYWQVRLVSPTTGDKTYAAARQGGVMLP